MVKKIIAIVIMAYAIFISFTVGILESMPESFSRIYDSILDFKLLLYGILIFVGGISYIAIVMIGAIAISYYLWNKDKIEDRTYATGIHRHNWPERDWD